MMPDISGRRRATEFRERVSLGLAAMGVRAQPVPPAKRPSEAFSGPFGHIVVDAPGVTVVTRATFDFRPSEILDIAERAAADDGHEIGVGVAFRQMAPVEKQYVVLSLQTLAVLLKDRREACS